MNSQPRIAITMGDPAGSGPELCLRALAERSILQICTPLIYGDMAVLRAVAQRCGLSTPETTQVIDFCRIAPDQFTPGEVSAEAGAASFAYVDAAIRAAL